MSEEKQPQNELEKKEQMTTEEEVVHKPEKDLSQEIEELSQEAIEIELPTEEEIEAEMTAEDINDTENTPIETESEVPVEEEPIVKKDYGTMTPVELTAEVKRLMTAHPVQNLKAYVDEIKATVDSKFTQEQESAKNSFLEEGGNIIDFRFFSADKKAFNETYYEYRNKRSSYYQNKQKDQKGNLEQRQSLIEELKALRQELGGEESVNATFNKFRDIQERWNNAGNIPRDRYNLVWNNYYHHVDSFYELLHLNRSFRDKHFADNLEKKMQLIERVEELDQETNIGKAFKELQLLHRMWKEEIGPVSKEYSDQIWDRFSTATKKIHDKRDAHFKEVEKKWEANLIVKQEIISKITDIAKNEVTSHKMVQDRIKEVESLRDAFFKAGKVPSQVNEETWSAFKYAVKVFNHKKNGFYKSQKQEQYDNLAKKRELIKIAQDNKDNEDVNTTIDLMKKIQADWKKIGHVPRKDSDKVWNEFKEACNHFFDRIHASKKESNEKEVEALKKKNELLETLQKLKLEGEHQEKLSQITSHINQWKEIGRVPYAKRSIDEKFNKTLDGLFKQLDIDKKQIEMLKYENRLQNMQESDGKALQKEKFFISKKIQEIKSDINQLENNLGFFQHVKDDNPLVLDVKKNIEKHKTSLEIWEAKYRKIKNL